MQGEKIERGPEAVSQILDVWKVPSAFGWFKKDKVYIKNEAYTGLSHGVTSFPEHVVVLVSQEMQFCHSDVGGDGGHTGMSLSGSPEKNSRIILKGCTWLGGEF